MQTISICMRPLATIQTEFGKIPPLNQMCSNRTPKLIPGTHNSNWIVGRKANKKTINCVRTEHQCDSKKEKEKNLLNAMISCSRRTLGQFTAPHPPISHPCRLEPLFQIEWPAWNRKMTLEIQKNQQFHRNWKKKLMSNFWWNPNPKTKSKFNLIKHWHRPIVRHNKIYSLKAKKKCHEKKTKCTGSLTKQRETRPCALRMQVKKNTVHFMWKKFSPGAIVLCGKKMQGETSRNTLD